MLCARGDLAGSRDVQQHPVVRFLVMRLYFILLMVENVHMLNLNELHYTIDGRGE